MSSRTVPRFALTGVLAAALAAPAVAQDAPPLAPMPRPAGNVTGSVHAYNWASLRRVMEVPQPVAVAPMPHERGGGEACCQTLRDVFAFAQMPQPAPPEVPACGHCAPTPFGGNVSGTRVPRPTAFVIGAGGLQRVMPMPEPPGFLVAPTPVPTGSFVIEIDAFTRAQLPAPRALVLGAAPGCAPGVVMAGGVQLVGVVDSSPVCPPCPLPVAANPLNGTWCRDMGIAVIAISFAGDEMTVRAIQRDDERTVTFTLTAHCAVTKDGLVYGAITSADVDLKGNGKSDAANRMELAELSLLMQEMIDQPFSFRAKATSAGLMVSGLKAVPIEGVGGKDIAVLGGLYKHAKDGKLPETVSVKTAGAVGRCDSGPARADVIVAIPAEPYRLAVGAALGSTAGTAAAALIGAACDRCPAPTVERIGVDFTVIPPIMSQPLPPNAVAPLAPAHQKAPPVRPIPADAMQQMAHDAFQQMILERQTWHGGMTLPSGRYLEHFPQYFPPDPAFPLPRELASQEMVGKPCELGCCAKQVTVAAVTSAAKPGAVGTWVREVGSTRCVVKVATDHLTATVSESHEVDGKTITGHMTFTIEYHMARDGVTAVGLLTGVDAKFEGDLPGADAETMMQKVGELQRLLEDKPVALTLRVYADALVIGNVRMQTVGGLLECEPASYIGGRYRTTSDKPLPALKTVKTAPPKPLPVYGSGPPLPDAIPPALYVPPGGLAPAPVGDLLPPQHIGRTLTPPPAPVRELPPIPAVEALPATPTVRVIQAVTVPEPVLPVTAPKMPEPIPPVVPAEKPKPTKKEKKQKYSSDPNVRMQQLLQQSEDLRQIHNEWRRFWFPDPSSHLTPERIHGGINGR